MLFRAPVPMQLSVAPPLRRRGQKREQRFKTRSVQKQRLSGTRDGGKLHGADKTPSETSSEAGPVGPSDKCWIVLGRAN